MLTTFGLMNVIIGVVVDNVISQAGDCDAELQAKSKLQRFEVCLAAYKVTDRLPL